jgi:signal transduction histidine kinase/DNA-binding LacI/PurR family transcriptional regulator/AraC-like DNA-binding protein
MSARPRHTIGLLFPGLVDFGAMCWGAFDAAARHGANAICFQGAPLQSPISAHTPANVLYDFVTSGTPLDGLVIWTGWFSQFVGPAEARRYLKRFAPLPIVSISEQIDGIPCVLGDNTSSMFEIVSHLVEVHQCRRLAFVNGPRDHLESTERYAAYLNALNHYQIAFDSTLVINKPFRHEAGVEAARYLLDQCERMDAVITSDDFVALGVIEGLQQNGVRVPEDVAVTGFDDTPNARASIPPLTTVRQSAYDQGFQGAELLLKRLAGQDTPMQVYVPMQLAIRQSCGCASPIVRRAITTTSRSDPQHWSFAGGQRTAIVAAIKQEIQAINAGINTHAVEPLCDAFAAEMTGTQAGVFINTLEAVLRDWIAVDADLFAGQDIISAMRQTILPLLADRADIVLATNLWGQARVLIGELALRSFSQRRLKAEQQLRLLREIGQELITTFDLDELLALLAHRIPRLGIKECWLALYDLSLDAVADVPPRSAHLMIGLHEGQPVPITPNMQRFPVQHLSIDWLTGQNEPFQLILEPLYFREHQLGFVLFGPGPRDGTIYEGLRGYLITAIYGALLFQHNLELYEEALAARAQAEKADQLKTRLLANVSHDLRTPLNVILGYTRSALADPDQFAAPLPPAIQNDLDHIASNAEYLLRIINDLLDLSRAEINELDLHPEIIETRRLLESVFADMAQNVDSAHGVQWALRLPDRLPLITADPNRLRQILFNLLSNAHRYTARGHITLGADIVPPYLHIWVSDTGRGIPLESQQRIFEAFETVQDEGDQSHGIGLGLSIVRRLVALHRGTVSLESAPGRGSTFHVYLPLPGDPGLQQDRAPSTARAATVLVLSASAALAPYIQDMAQRYDWEIATVASEQALDTILADDSQRYVAVAWDLATAHPADWTLVQRIRAHPQFCSLPFLLFGDHLRFTSTDKTETVSVPMTQVMLKPFQSETMLDAIGRLLPASSAQPLLVVDDDPQALALYERLIQRAMPHHRIVLAESGTAALRFLDDGLVPALVILDLMMPDIDGFDVLARLRDREATHHVPVLVLSGKLLTVEDIRRLNYQDVLIHSKGVLLDPELEAVVQSVVTEGISLDRRTSELVKLTMAYIHQHYDQPFTRQEICRVLGVSPNYLSRIFRQELGITLVEYTNRYRMRIARQLLGETDALITEVAQQVGFDDAAYFSRVFKRYTNHSPRAFRQLAAAASPADSVLPE